MPRAKVDSLVVEMGAEATKLIEIVHAGGASP
jgi:hypothetical protein